jgi:hypothetical protein
MKPKRPILLTFMCSFIIIKAIFSLIWLYLNIYLPIINYPYFIWHKIENIPIALLLGLIILDIIINLWSAIGMLSGKKQARSVYVGYNILLLIILIISILTIFNMENALSVTKLVLILVVFRMIDLGLLYIPNINRYFDRSKVYSFSKISYFN